MRYLCALAAVAAIGWSLAYPQDALAVGWCGGGETATDVLPDAIGGDQIHVIYAYPSDGPDRFAELVGLIARDVDDVVRWWRSQDATRAPRFDLLRPDCLDIASVRLTESAAQINSDVRYSAIARGLETVLADVHKKGLLYYDSPIPLGGPYCGEAAIAPDNGGPRAFAAVYLASNLNGWSGCGFLGAGHYTAVTAAHEIVHSLGALVPGAPNACPNDRGHPCDSITDVLVAGGGDCCLSGRVLDFGRNDYYGHGGSWWDVRNSTWLSHLDAPPQTLSVRIAGDAGETVVESDLPGIVCPPACSVPYDGGETVQLAVDLPEGRMLRRWEGDCTGATECSVQMTAPRTVTAAVERIRYQLVVRVRGKGRVTSAPRGLVSCPRKCRASFAYGKTVRLTARAARGSRFIGWSGACSGRGTCSVAEHATVTARFR